MSCSTCVLLLPLSFAIQSKKVCQFFLPVSQKGGTQQSFTRGELQLFRERLSEKSTRGIPEK